nr:hypothetical protein [Chlamydiota bacterium]
MLAVKNLNRTTLEELIAGGEDSSHQFKTDIRNEISLAAEMVSFSNTEGGTLFIGVADDGLIPGLDKK